MERIPEAELAGYLARVPQWTREGIEITRTFTFRNFREAMEFVVQVALLAERADHHPDIDIRYKHVTLRLSPPAEWVLRRSRSTNSYDARHSDCRHGADAGVRPRRH